MHRLCAQDGYRQEKSIGAKTTYLARVLAAVSLVLCMTQVHGADYPVASLLSVQDTSFAREASSLRHVEVGKDYALGLNRFAVDAHTEILGWKIANQWYFGRQDGLDSGLTLVWQQDASQVSISRDGVRLTHRF